MIVDITIQLSGAQETEIKLKAELLELQCKLASVQAYITTLEAEGNAPVVDSGNGYSTPGILQCGDLSKELQSEAKAFVRNHCLETSLQE